VSPDDRQLTEAIRPLLDLTETERATFLQEFATALTAADPAPAAGVLLSWQRSMLTRRSPTYSDIPGRVGKGRLYSQDELKAELGLCE
jgi:hypothetical protein